MCLSWTLTLSSLPSRCHPSPPIPMVLTLQGPHQSPVTCWWDMLPPLCGVSSSQLQNLPLSSMEVPGDGRMLIGHILPGMPLCSQGPAGSPKAQPHAMHPPAPGLPGTSLEVFGLHGLSLLCSPCWDTSFPEPKGEMWKSAPLFSFFRKNTEQIYFCTSLTCPAT